MYPGENLTVVLVVENTMNKTNTIYAKPIGEIDSFINISAGKITLNPYEKGSLTIPITIPKDVFPGTYEGKILLDNGNSTTQVPISIRILDLRNLPVSIDIQPLMDKVYPGRDLRYSFKLFNSGKTQIPLNYTISFVNPQTGEIITSFSGNTTLVSSYEKELKIHIPKNISLDKGSIEGLTNVLSKRYMLKADIIYFEKGHKIEASEVAFVSVEKISYIPDYMIAGLKLKHWILLIALLLILVSSRHSIYEYIMSKRRYKMDVNLRYLPKPTKHSGFIGHVAETKIRTFVDLNTLQTHTIIAGSTGGGKTVSAQAIIEEALQKNKSVIVFDPTAQWSGFLRKCKDKKMLKLYPGFNMPLTDVKSFKGNVHMVNSPWEIIDMKKYIERKGEIHVFTINKLKPSEIDIFVSNTIRQVFEANLNESQELKSLIVYDEVHRLLSKFGGSGEGFIQVERGAREFRKWGVGLVLISQVLSDFVGAIKSNIGTEIQMRTKDEGDMDRIRLKYGENTMKSLLKASIGSGMYVNAEYNKGAPYFVTFRPLYHNIERLSDEELQKYYKYNNILDDIEYQSEQLKEENVDVFDIEIELKIARSKLMSGAFNMVDIYIESIRPMLNNNWKKLGKTPKKRQTKLVSKDALVQSIETAKQKREEYLKNKVDEVKAQNKKPQNKKEEIYQIKQEVASKTQLVMPKKEEENKKAKAGEQPVRAETEDNKSAPGRNKEPPEEPIVDEKQEKETEIDKMIDDYNQILNKIKEKEEKGENMYLIKLNTLNLLNEIEFLKKSDVKEEKQKMNDKLKKLKKLLNT